MMFQSMEVDGLGKKRNMAEPGYTRHARQRAKDSRPSVFPVSRQNGAAMTVYTQPHFENRVVNHVPVRCLRTAGSTLVEFRDYARAVGTPCESALSALVRSGAPFVAIDGLMFTPAEMVRRIPGNDDYALEGCA